MPLINSNLMAPFIGCFTFISFNYFKSAGLICSLPMARLAKKERMVEKAFSEFSFRSYCGLLICIQLVQLNGKTSKAALRNTVSTGHSQIDYIPADCESCESNDPISPKENNTSTPNAILKQLMLRLTNIPQYFLANLSS